MHEIDERWMAYIDREVRHACDKKGWGYQIRRKWSVREKPVSESSVEDYEWKLIPGCSGGLPKQSATDIDEGTYYVLRLDRRSGKFILQHDTAHCGDWGPHMDLCTYTEIHVAGIHARSQRHVQGIKHERLLAEPGPDGWLRDHLVDLTTRFQPNRFSIT
jgi:hypothetical protein